MASADGKFIMGGVEGKIRSDPKPGGAPAIKPSVRRALEIRQEKKWLRHQLEDTFSDASADLEDLGW